MLLELEELTGSSDRELVLSKFNSRVSKGPDCWNWTGTKTPRGYGKYNFQAGKAAKYAHRLSYVLFNGPFEKSLDIDHKCRNTSCVNPAHLEPVTKAENNRRAREATRSDVCPNGHPYTERTTYIDPRGVRQCRDCRKEAARLWRKRNNTN